MADSCFISCAKINSARGPCGVGSCPVLPGKGLIFPGELLRGGCCTVLGVARLPGAQGAPRVTSAVEGQGTVSPEMPMGNPESFGGFSPKRDAYREGDRGSAKATEPESKASSSCSHSQWLFAQMVQGKGRIQLFWALKGICLWSLQHPKLLSPRITNT